MADGSTAVCVCLLAWHSPSSPNRHLALTGLLGVWVFEAACFTTRLGHNTVRCRDPAVCVDTSNIA